MNIGYAVKRLLGMNFKRVGSDIKRVSKKSGKSPVIIFFDMIICGIKYGAGPLDYDLFEFYNLNSKQRKTYITRGVNNALVKKYNSKKHMYIFDNKAEFNNTFSKFINRDWLATSNMEYDAFCDFCKNKTCFIYKPIDGTCGRGIEKINFESTSYKQLFDEFKAKPNGIIEEVIIQHDALNAIYPLAINTARIVTIYKDGIVTPVFAFLRIGNNGKFVDNLNSGGMAAMLDIKTGSIALPAADKTGAQFTKHPYTNADIVGFTLPLWDKAIETVTNAAKVLNQVGYVGWDIAFSSDSVQIIEGNCFPGHDILQLPAYTPDKIGLMSKIEKFIK